MSFTKAEFVASFADGAAAPRVRLPEIAMAGRSNVGKSSLINMIAGRTKLARTSQEPGKTRMINYYSLDDSVYIVDLPGYGFARASKAEKDRWGEMIERYLRGNDRLKNVFQLVDIRHQPTADDRLMTEYLRHYEIPFTVIATKADKLSRAEISRSIPVICRTLAVQPWEIIQTSAVDRRGRDEIHARMSEIINGRDNGENNGN